MAAQRESQTSLVEVLDRVLDKGVVIDAHVLVAIVGVELLAVEARVIVASFQTYLTHADALAFTRPAARPHPPDEILAGGEPTAGGQVIPPAGPPPDAAAGGPPPMPPR